MPVGRPLLNIGPRRPKSWGIKMNKLNAAGSYCEVWLNTYMGSKEGRNIYGEFISIPVPRAYYSKGATIEVAPPTPSFPSNGDLDDFLEF